jgi:NitT/TauT family transport system substrate-binding protein
MSRPLLRALASIAITLGLAGPVGAAELKVGYIPIVPMSQLFVMEGEGWTREADLKLDLVSFSSGPALIQALVAGQLDAAYVGIGPAMVARAKGVEIKVVASNVVEQVALLGRGDLAKAFEGAPSAAEALKAFRERAGRPAKIATLPAGAVPNTVLQHWLQEVAKVPAADVQVVGMGEEQVQQALLAQAVDAASILEPILTIVQERDETARIIAPAGTMFPGQPGAVLAVQESVIARDRGAVQRLVALHLRATEAIKADPSSAARHVTQFVGKGLVDPAVIERALKSPNTRMVADPNAIIGPTKAMQAFQVKLGVQAEAVDVDGLFDTSFFAAAAK